MYGGTFGFKSEIERLGEKYGIEEAKRLNVYDDTKRKNECIKEYQKHLQIADVLYGNLNKYRKAYVDGLINYNPWSLPIVINNVNLGNFDIPKKFRRNYLSKIDLSKPDLEYRENVYLKLAEAACGNEMGLIIYGDKIEEKVKEFLQTLQPKKCEILKMRFNTEGKELAREQIAKNFDISGHRIEQIEVKELNSLKNYLSKNMLNICANLDADREEEIVRKYFAEHDIFAQNSYNSLNKEFTKEIMDLVNNGIIERKQKEAKIKYFYHLPIEEQSEIIARVIKKVGNFKNLKFLKNYLKEQYSSYDKTTKMPDEMYNEIINAVIKQALEFPDIWEKVEKIRKSKTIEIEDVNIENLDFSVRTFNNLYKKGIHNLSNLLTMTEEEIRKVGDLSQKSFNEVIFKIHDLGLYTKNECIENGYTVIIVPKENKKEENNYGNGERTIETLKLSRRATNCLKRNNITLVSELSNKTQDQILEIKGLGTKCYKDIISKMHSAGILTKDEREELEIEEK